MFPGNPALVFRRRISKYFLTEVLMISSKANNQNAL